MSPSAGIAEADPIGWLVAPGSAWHLLDLQHSEGTSPICGGGAAGALVN